MKTLLLLFLISISLIASEEEATAQQGKVREMPSYVVDAKFYGLVPAEDAFYVIDSVKYGTMKENFAFAYEKDAQEYVQKNGGSVVDYKTYINMDVNISK